MDHQNWEKWVSANVGNFASKAREGFRKAGRGFLKVPNMDKQEVTQTQVKVEYYQISSMQNPEALEILKAYDPKTEMVLLLESPSKSGYFRIEMPSQPS